MSDGCEIALRLSSRFDLTSVQMVVRTGSGSGTGSAIRCILMINRQPWKESQKCRDEDGGFIKYRGGHYQYYCTIHIISTPATQATFCISRKHYMSGVDWPQTGCDGRNHGHLITLSMGKRR